jgi:beta-galactosidase
MSTESVDNLLWGAATSAFQVEGAAADDGKGPSIWDVFCATPGKIVSGATGQVACDHYHRYPQDVALMRRLGLRAYRFSVSWPRVVPAGRGTANPAGLDFYDRLVDALCAAGIEPFVTLYHWDLPAALQTDLGGWAHPDLPHLFADYAELVFNRLGDRVRYWLTLNEPWVVVVAGYFDGIHPPGIKDRALGYRVGHNLLRAHAAAVARCRAGRSSPGSISFALNANYSFPATDASADVAAAERAMQNFAGWFGDPVYHGDYPAVMRARLGALLPQFTPEEAQLLKGSTDFLALNYYTSDVVRHAVDAGPMEAEVVPQPHVPQTAMGWPIRPDGLRCLLRWVSDRYARPPIYITENGAAFDDQPDEAGFVDDQNRTAYLREHIAAAAAARDDGVDLRGYFVWSLLDNLEWTEGFAKRFGLVRCDYATQTRTIKASGHWYGRLIRAGKLADDRTALPKASGGMV